MAGTNEVAAFVRGVVARLVADDSQRLASLRLALAHIGRRNASVLADFPGLSADGPDEATSAAMEAAAVYGGETPRCGVVWLVDEVGRPVGEGAPAWMATGAGHDIRTIGPFATKLAGYSRAVLFYRTSSAAESDAPPFAMDPRLVPERSTEAARPPGASSNEANDIRGGGLAIVAIVAACIALAGVWYLTLLSGQTARASLQVTKSITTPGAPTCAAGAPPFGGVNTQRIDSWIGQLSVGSPGIDPISGKPLPSDKDMADQWFNKIKKNANIRVDSGSMVADCGKLASAIAASLSAQGLESPFVTIFSEISMPSPLFANIMKWAVDKVIKAAGRLDLSVLILVHWIALVGLVVALGAATRGTPWGLVIDADRNRVSLSRTQAVAWTIVILGAVFAFAAFNLGIVGSVAGDAAAAAVIIPEMDLYHWTLLLGAGAIPAVVAHLTKTKDLDGKLLEAKDRPKDAGVGDLIVSEVEQEKRSPDIARLQNLAITVFLVASFATQIQDYARSLDFVSLINATTIQSFSKLPAISEQFLGLLALSHGGYLGSKFYSLNKKPS